jgi:uncharacterized protein DUF4157
MTMAFIRTSRTLDKTPASMTFSPRRKSRSGERSIDSQNRFEESRVPLASASLGIQPKLKMGEPNDKFERQADRVAEMVMHSTRPCSNVASSSDLPTSTYPAGLQGQVNELAHGGQALPPSLRAFFEPRFGLDFSQVRIHTDDRSAMAAGRLRARAFTMGSDIVFGDGEFAPDTTGGKALLAHELAHTTQQQKGAVGNHSSAQGLTSATTKPPAIQRQPAKSQPEITVQDVFPFPKGSKVGLANAVPEGLRRILGALQPGVAAALNTIQGQQATVVNATPDLFEAQIAGPITIPATAGQEARTIKDIILGLRRTSNTFEFSLTGLVGEQTVRTSLLEEFGPLGGLTATRDRGGIVLSRGGATPEPLLQVTPRGKDELLISAFTQAMVGMTMNPDTVEVIGITRLPDAKTDAEVESALKKFVDKQEGRSRTPRQEVSVGVGAQFADERSLLLTTSWQIRFPSTRLLGPLGLKSATRAIAGEIAQIPLELQIQYAPGVSVLGGVSSGVAARLPTRVPVNIRLVVGVGGGSIASGEEGETLPVFGPTVGGAVGVELGRWRANLRAERLLNLVGNSKDATSLFLTLGRAI